LSLPELFAAVDRVLRIAKKPTVHDVVPRAIDVDGAIATVRAVLALRARAGWGDLVNRDAEPWQVLSLLLALLELAKRGELKVAQARPFASVEITSDPASEAA
jgi:segregation and condensation protein A